MLGFGATGEFAVSQFDDDPANLDGAAVVPAFTCAAFLAALGSTAGAAVIPPFTGAGALLDQDAVSGAGLVPPFQAGGTFGVECALAGAGLVPPCGLAAAILGPLQLAGASSVPPFTLTGQMIRIDRMRFRFIAGRASGATIAGQPTLGEITGKTYEASISGRA